ncbi:hypothetical protein [Pantoea dispersa]|uniref:hypothetical protein n=1 Tax=Pantoea dispersa TaxID=59814 RepID=UPI001238E3CF|nr:hypothetical protein [Pantoea dispersa]KAA8669628.1 hypothetical protein F4W08_16025 [Pantoea dispersa]
MLNNMLVTILDPNRIVVEVRGSNDGAILLSLGFSKKNNSYSIKTNNEKEQLSIVEQLANANALFSYGQGWAPSEVMGYLKDDGKIKFPYKVIMWRSPNNYEIIDK